MPKRRSGAYASRRKKPGVPSTKRRPGRGGSISYRQVYDASPDAILLLSADGRYLHANPAACDMTGYSLAELKGMRVGDLTVPLERQRTQEEFEALRRDGRLRTARFLRLKDGSTLHVEVAASVAGADLYQAHLRELPESACGDANLGRALEAYSSLVELCHAAVISAGPDGRIRSWNPAAEKLFGYTAAEAIGMPVASLISHTLRDQHARAFTRHLKTRGKVPFHRILNGDALTKSGRTFPVEISLGVGRPGPDPIFTAVIRDMSEHKAVVEKLNQALQLLQFHVERMPLAYIVWDKDFRVVEWNPTAHRVFGFTKAEALGRHAYELIVPPDARQAVDKVWADLLSGDASSHALNPNVRKDGARLICEWFNTPLRDSAGNVCGVASMARDMTEHEAMQSRIRDAQKLESLGVLAGGVAHDFNSSLMVIMGNAALLRSTKGMPARAMGHIDLIEEAGSRASLLIKHLLAYARTGRHNPQPTDLNAVVQGSMAFVQSSLGKNYDVNLRLAPSVPLVRADRSQFEQILLNLCLNAKQASPKGGPITITTRATRLGAAELARCVPYDARPGEYVELIVSDTGCGMDATTRAKIFDPFFTTKPDGHGLGLAAVLGILRQHNAAAQVESAPGKGTKMHIYFPVAPK